METPRIDGSRGPVENIKHGSCHGGASLTLPIAVISIIPPASSWTSDKPLHLSQWISMADPEAARSMEGKVCLVTGATAGIGLVTARELRGEAPG